MSDIVNNISKINVSNLDYNIKDTKAAEHIAIIDGNPHGVTKAHLGLENVDNLSSSQILAGMEPAHIKNTLGYIPPSPTEVNNKVDKYSNDTIQGIINFENGIQIGGATVSFNSSTNTITFS